MCRLDGTSSPYGISGRAGFFPGQPFYALFAIFLKINLLPTPSTYIKK
jgi:hypothetical protein